MRMPTLTFLLLSVLLPLLFTPVVAYASTDAAAAVDVGTTVVDAAGSDAATVAAAPTGTAPSLPVVDPNAPVDMLQMIIQAFKEGHWAWAIGLILMLLTLIFNKLLRSRIPKKVVPWVAIGLGMATSVAMSLASGVGWLSAIGTGFTAGLAAVGGWEALGKLFKKKKDSA